MKNVTYLISLLFIAIIFLSCSSEEEPPGWQTGQIINGSTTASQTNYEITDYTLPTGNATVSLTGLNKNDRVVLIPLYTQQSTGSAALHTAFRLLAEYSGGDIPSTRALHRAPVVLPKLPYTLKKSDILKDGCPPVTEKAIQKKRSRAYTPGDIVNFNLMVDFDNSSAGFTSAPAKLLYMGSSCYVFFTSTLAAHSNAGAAATNIGVAFDTQIYPRLTSRFGYEWGGGPSGTGGVDGDTKIYILYENVTLNPPGGYFSSRNQSTTDPNSNQKEMFVICHNTGYLTTGYARHSTVAHEFQHLIEYNRVYKTVGVYQLSFFNEGLSQVAEGYAGYGPDTRISYVQDCPQLSYANWGVDDKNISYSYGAAFAIVSYMVRRFGANFITTLLDAPITSIENVTAALQSVGYSQGYSGIVLDMLTTQYLNQDQYSYPAASLYPGDIGINVHGTTPSYSGYPTPTTNASMLSGPRTKFYQQYPVALNGSLHNYGADMYEFVSGANGTLNFTFNEIQPGVKLRVIRYRIGSNTQPYIDGRFDDWEGRTVTTMSDPINDNNLLSTGSPAGSFASTSVDITSVRGYCTNDTLYLAINVQDPSAIHDTSNYFFAKLDITGTTASDYYVYFYTTKVHFRKIVGTSSYDIDLPSTGISYARQDGLEIRLPLTNFPATLKSDITVRMYGYTSGSPTIFDFPDNPLVLTR